MTYDLYGSWDSVARPHTALYAPDATDPALFSVERAVNAWLANGTPASKLMVGLATYARCFTLQGTDYDLTKSNVGAKSIDAGADGLVGFATEQADYIAYFELKEYVAKNNGVVMFDEVTRSNIAQWKETVNGKQYVRWCGYDDVRALQEKTAYIKSKNLGGGFFWAADLDDYKNGNPLARAMGPLLQDN